MQACCTEIMTYLVQDPVLLLAKSMELTSTQHDRPGRGGSRGDLQERQNR